MKRFPIKSTLGGVLAAAGLIASVLISEARTQGCPNLGVQRVNTQILDAVDGSGKPATQDCPAIQLGLGLPGIGHVRIVTLHGGVCPVAQVKIDLHHEIVSKVDFEVIQNGTFTIWERKVTCDDDMDFIVLGFPNCENGDWLKLVTLPDYSDKPCGMSQS